MIFLNPTQVYRDYNKPLPSLKLTTNAPENWWLEDEFPFGARLPGRCYVSFKEGIPINQPGFNGMSLVGFFRGSSGDRITSI